MVFIRAISGKLNKNTISLLVKTQNVSFSCYKFCFQSFLKSIIFPTFNNYDPNPRQKSIATAYDLREMLKLLYF